MSWFGGSRKDDSAKSQPMKIDDFDEESSFAHESTNFALGPSGGAGSFEQEIVMEQQKAVIQAVMFKLTETAFDSCITKPSSSLSYSEQSCIQAVVGKYLDTSELVVSRLQNQEK